MWTLVLLAIYGEILLLIWQGTKEVTLGRLTPGNLVLFGGTLLFVGLSVASLGDAFTRIQRVTGCAERVFKLIRDSTCDELSGSNVVEAKSEGGEIAFGMFVFVIQVSHKNALSMI